jgi:predicted RNA-binding Zn ribbon-like protein
VVFKLVAGNAALDFVNTLDDRFGPNGPTELISTYSDLVEFAVQTGVLIGADHLGRGSAGVLSQARELRETLAAVFYASADGVRAKSGDLAKLSTFVQEAALHRRLVRQDSGFGWMWLTSTDSRLPIWALAQAAADLLTSPSVNLIRTCGCETCRWLFLDESKNGRRRWCDMRLCGNRVKARRFQNRKRATKRKD